MASRMKSPMEGLSLSSRSCPFQLSNLEERKGCQSLNPVFSIAMQRYWLPAWVGIRKDWKLINCKVNICIFFTIILSSISSTPRLLSGWSPLLLLKGNRCHQIGIPHLNGHQTCSLLASAPSCLPLEELGSSTWALSGSELCSLPTWLP